ncbi:MAG: UbiA-like polyprenyltransferase [Planctomycetia bacterium]|nr:UbiA-like polyprenyltransferase [Planctomycetia bacterium]
MWPKLRSYLELIRFSHTLFALPFALLSAFMAWYVNFHPELAQVPERGFRWQDLAGILLAMVFARSAAMAFNRLADQAIDAQNPRTSGRHLPAGKLTRKGVWGFTGICSFGFILSTCCFLPGNPIPLFMSVPVLLFLFGYSLAKRFTQWVHFWLGGALMLAPVAAWVAIRGGVWWNLWLEWQKGSPLIWPTVEWSPFLLASGVLFWTAGFDMIYACMDAEFDQTHDVFSIPGKYGIPTALRLAAGCHFLMLFPLVGCGFLFPPFQTAWMVGMGLIAGLLVYEHAIVDVRNPGRVNQAFFHVNALISMTLLLLGVGEILWHW